jgi:hypothetical protein
VGEDVGIYEHVIGVRSRKWLTKYGTRPDRMLYKKGAYPPWEYHEVFLISFITSRKSAPARDVCFMDVASQHSKIVKLYMYSI